MTDQTWLDRAVRLAVENVATGGGPFGAVVVRDGVVVAEGTNRVTPDLDPTAHAEVVAVRRACAELGTFTLAGCALYTSCEPCPLCLAASLWARLDRVVYAADRDDAAGAGFDDRAFYDLVAADRATWPMPVTAEPLTQRLAPFDAWLTKADRTAY
ncbi:nucleoside deaminase [Nocardioides marmotae]|uniref:nucleoside deaminase n=1 Tax=Nocardioides marmotae TaxID=2663857 RepID=UPI00132988F9|nr:nucleoside deaminase [Nocardioides marmotae]MBC9734983.1 nucleoside deaminase [Nocardioides marmotae]MTB86083.1 nucleoside deaminase [Nocardioides marmotae]